MAFNQRPIRVLLLTKHTRRGASSRMRFLQFLSPLEKRGFVFDECPFFSDEAHLDKRYEKGGIGRSAVIKAYLGRFRALCQVRRHDVVWLQAEALPYLPSWADSLLSIQGRPIVVDYDDAIFHQYDSANSKLIRKVLGGKIKSIMRTVDTVVVGNSYLGEYASRAGADRIIEIPTVIDASRYESVPRTHSASPVIGWIGTPVTAKFVRKIIPALENVMEKTGAGVTLIGAGDEISDAFKTHKPNIVEWSEKTETEELAKIDLGLMPLNLTKFDLGKCGYKLIQYMASGAAVLATDSPANRAIVNRSHSGRILPEAASPAEWSNVIVEMLADRRALKKMGESGRIATKEVYSLNAQVERVENLLRAADQRSTRL